MKAVRAIGPLMLMLSPAVCLADAGSLGGVVDLFFYLLLFAGIWFSLTAALVWLLRKSSPVKRFGLSLLFLVSPVLFLIGWIAVAQFLGSAGSRVDSLATNPVVVEGVSFPAGSQVTYEQLGGGFWHKRPVAATTDRKVMLGTLEINELEQVEHYPDAYYAVLTHPQTIEGWLCVDRAPIDFRKIDGQLHFKGCELAAPNTMGNMIWPTLTKVTRNDDGSWTLSRPSDSDGPPAQAFGMQFRAMDATYSPVLVLKQWSAQAFEENETFGDYTFSNQGWDSLYLTADGDIRIEGGAKNIKTGQSIDCVLVQLQARRATPCKPE